MSRPVSIVKPWIVIGFLIIILKVTGLLGAISSHSHAILMKTGLLDADVKAVPAIEAFPFDFQLRRTDGRLVSVNDLKGKVIFLNIWATWCGPCRAEMPGIQQLYSSLASDSMIFVMLSIDKKSDDAKVVKYLADKGFSFPGFRPVNYLPEILNVPSIPTTFVIDKRGNIAFKKVGTANYNTSRFKNFLKRQLAAPL
jgi:thiol-disulfide isomerase/thioredoxin